MKVVLKPVGFRIFLHSLITLALYSIVYLVYTFTVWEFKNPLLWLFKLPSYDEESRFMILFYWTAYHVILGIIVCEITKPKKD